MKLQSLLLLILLTFSSHSFAGNETGHSLQQLSWLEGCWKGTGLGGEVEECWLSSPDNRMTSVFQMTEEGVQRFTEIVMIAEFDGSLGMRVKHFDAAFTQWDSDNVVGITFPFVEIGENFIQFEGLRYELIDDACHVTLDMHSGEEIKQVGFVYKRN